MKSTIHLKKRKIFALKASSVVEIIYGLFITLFLYTALSKLMHFTSFTIAIIKSPVIYQYPKLVAYTVPISEILVSALLFFPQTRRIGLYASFVLMMVFTIYVAYVLIAHKTELPCTCGGVLKQLTWPQHLVFNLIFTVLAVIGIRLHKQVIIRKADA